MTGNPSDRPGSDHELVFVGGMHRSGTTLLARILATSPSASGLEGSGAHMGEGQFLQDVYPVGKEYGGVTRWALDPRSHLTEADVADPEEAGARLWQAWSPHWDLSARYLVEKTPLNISKTRYLQRVFPRSSFVVITRHPATQALAARKWSPTRLGRRGRGFDSLIENWVVAHERLEEDRPHLERVLVVRYERLIADPHTEIARLERFLGIALPDAHGQFDASRTLGYEEEWDAVLGRTSSRPAGRGSLRVGERLLLAPAARRAVNSYGTRVSALGYDLQDVRQAPTD